MPIKLVALYRRPDDVDTLMDHYEQIHLPLVAKSPHLLKTVAGHVIGSPMGDPALFLMAEMFSLTPSASRRRCDPTRTARPART